MCKGIHVLKSGIPCSNFWNTLFHFLEHPVLKIRTPPENYGVGVIEPQGVAEILLSLLRLYITKDFKY